MTFTLSTKSRRVCAHPTSPCSPIPHTVLFFSIRVSCRISRGTLPRAAGPSAPRRSPHGAAGGCRLWRRAAGPLPPPPLALQLICGLAGGALGAREARGRGARRSPFCLPRRRSFFFVFCLAAARGASTAAAAAEAAAAAAAEALSEPHRWEARARAGRSRAALLAAQPHQRHSGGLLLSLGGTLVRLRCAGTTGRGTLATAPARCGSGLRDVGPRRGRRSCRRPSGGWAAGSLALSSAGGHRGGRSGAARGPAESAAREASRGPSPSAGTVSGAAAGCPAPLAPGRRPAAAREGWIGRRDGRQSLVRLAGIPVYALNATLTALYFFAALRNDR